jgi:hypothetical protein
MTAQALSPDYQRLMGMLQSSLGQMHAHWCTRPCDGVCSTTVSITGAEGRRLQVSAELARGTTAPTVTVVDEWTGQRLVLDAAATRQIAALVAAWSAPESLPEPGLRPQQ